ncbi:MAG: DHHA1 domain-containing protein [Candidatus Bathyarchaeia archaeon]
MNSTVIVAHSDSDGIVAASIVSIPEKITIDDEHVHFTEPHLLNKTLGKISPHDKLYILDLAVDQQKKSKVFSELRRLSGGGTEIIYIDHHLITDADLRILNTLPDTTYYHSSGPSASQLTSEWVQKKWELSEAMLSRIEKLAELGGISDRCIYPRSPIGEREALILDESWRANSFDHDFRRFLVRELRDGKMPSQIPQAVENYRKAIKMRREVIKKMEQAISFDGPTLLVSSPKERLHGHVGPALSELANRRRRIAFGIFRPIDADYFVVCGRAPDDYKGGLHLGRLLAEMCAGFSGSGGGHKLAAGGRIAPEAKDRFIELLKLQIEAPMEKAF